MPVWSEVVADTLTPVAAFAQRRRRRAGLPARVGRGRRALGPLLASSAARRWPRWSPAAATSTVDRAPCRCRPATAGACWPPSKRAARALPLAGRSPTCRRSTAGVVGYLGYDVVREVEHLPDVPAGRPGLPRRRARSVIGQLAAFDHWRQRVVLVDNVVVDGRLGAGRARRRPTPAAGDRLAAAGRRLLPGGAVRPRCRSPARGDRGRPSGRGRMSSAGVPGRGGGGQGAHRGRRHLPGRALPALRPRRSSADPFDVYRALRLLNPSPYLYFLRFDEVTVVGSSPEPMVRLRDGRGHLPPDRRDPAAGARTERGGPAAGRPSWSRTRRSVAEHVMLVDLARNDVGRVVTLRHRAGRRVHDRRALQPRHAPDLAGVGPAAPTARARSTCCGPRCRPGPCRARRRCGPWRSSTSSSRPSAASTAASSATSTSRATSTPPSPSAPWSSAPDGRASVQAGAGIVADSDPATEDAECAHKAAALLAAVAAARRDGRASR